jgi:hypothetical protein
VAKASIAGLTSFYIFDYRIGSIDLYRSKRTEGRGI